ncbi:hypothetical protein [Fibrivirga algicola]|nr:hypothetical protein [Fibrivirga algicola]
MQWNSNTTTYVPSWEVASTLQVQQTVQGAGWVLTVTVPPLIPTTAQ